jgi:uncharacterized membrane protein
MADNPAIWIGPLDIAHHNISSNLATAIRTVVILLFAWVIALVPSHQPLSTIGKRTWG